MSKKDFGKISLLDSPQSTQSMQTMQTIEESKEFPTTQK